MSYTPTDVANLALDAVGRDVELGNIEEGGREANLCLRAYAKCRRELMRGAPWQFARTQKPLLLLADQSGNTPNVSTSVASGQFQYEYFYPADCARIRYIPWNPYQTPFTPTGNITPPNASSPLTSGQQPAQLWLPIRPSLYLVTNDPNIVTAPGPDGTNQQGQSPVGSTVILSNVQNASCIYTFDAVYPSLWDPLFLGAMIAYMASEICVGLWMEKDRQQAIKIRDEQIAIAKQKIGEARIADGNEGTTSTDHMASWTQARFAGTSSWAWGAGPFAAGGTGTWGTWGAGWTGSVGFSDGSAY